MRNSFKCPKCGGQKLWAIEHVQHVDAFGKVGGYTKVAPSSLTAAEMPEKGLLWGENVVAKSVGTLEAWACDTCSYVEFYAHDLSALRTLADHADSGVRLIDASSRTSPHR